jgi:opacity protein-like surface antigen
MKRVLFAALVAAALAAPSSAAAQGGELCDQPHSLDPPRLNCGPESALNEYLAILDPLWPWND